jgi:predicted permease
VILANTGYLGLPMAVALLGGGALPHAIAYDQVISGPMVFTAGFAVGAAFGVPAEGVAAPGLRARARAFLTRNPPLWGAVAGVVLRWAPSPLPQISRAVVEVALVTGFFAVGAYLSSERRKDHASLFSRPDAAVWIALGCRFLINPALLGAASLLGVAVPSAYLLQAAMPSGINGLIVGHAFGLDQRLIATVIVWSTVLAVSVGLGAQYL